MGQKTHPLGFRLGITQKNKALWYANFYRYRDILKEDDQIRTYLNKISKENKIANVYINRNPLNTKIQLTIETGSLSELIKKLKTKNSLKNIKKIIIPNSRLFIRIIQIRKKKIPTNASLLSDLLVDQLEKRIAFRRAIRSILKMAKKAKVNGIKIQISGRLNGAEIARNEWVREGRVPLQTLRAKIDYVNKEAYTIYGTLGIKIWVFKRKKFKRKKFKRKKNKNIIY